jgi:hypothetical protein
MLLYYQLTVLFANFVRKKEKKVEYREHQVGFKYLEQI